MTGWRKVAAAVVVVVLATACGGGDDEARRADPVDDSGVEAGRGWVTEDGDREWRAGGGGGPDVAADDATATTAARVAEASREAGGAPAAGGEAVADEPASVPDHSGLRAGSVDDNDRWAGYLTYRDEFDRLGIAVRPFDVRDRHVVTVVDEAGRPVLGALVRSGDQEARTFADGRTLLYGPLAGDVTASLDEATASVPAAGATSHRLVLDVDREEGPARLDLHFLIDTTGSMGDEIDRLKTSVDAVARRISALPAEPDLRLGMTLYRDRGDVFVTRTFDLGAEVEAFAAALAEVQADGGGDTPEDLAAGLHEALDVPAWRGDDTIKVIVLIADAPPQLYDDAPDYLEGAREAARRGIKVAPVASSGLDDQGEYVFRQIAQLTMSRFTFLTYGADGASPGEGTEHHVSDYAVLSLDDLIVRLVEDELRGATPAGQ